MFHFAQHTAGAKLWWAVDKVYDSTDRLAVKWGSDVNSGKWSWQGGSFNALTVV